MGISQLFYIYIYLSNARGFLFHVQKVQMKLAPKKLKL